MTKNIAALIATALLLVPGAATAAGDPLMGGKLFLQCRACHTIGAACGAAA